MDPIDSTSLASREDWQHVFALLDTALELEPPAITPWLASLPADQARLAPLLQELLDRRAAVESGDFMKSLAVTGLDDAVAPSAPSAAATPLPQTLIGPYRLLREIGRGGMASVWLAERADGLLDRRVALKLPHMSWGGARLAERMARERNILASLTHPNIARLYDAGIDAEGRPFLALEHVDGQPIDVYAASHGLAVRARIELVVQVARAVAHAHAQLIVHRDLKPSNILVDAQGRAHLLDFGIARLIDPPQGDGTQADGPQATLALGRALTPDYASPEQIRGDPIGTASDGYSLGIVAFELLAGVRPYRLKAGLGAVALAETIARTEIPRASAAAADDSRRQALRGDIDAILARTLSQDSRERYPNVDALADDLERHLRGEPVRARPPSQAYLADRWIRRHKIETGIALALVVALLGGAYAQVLVVLALGAGAVAALWQRNRALQQAERARVALARGEQVKNFIASIFTQAVPRAGHGGVVAAVDLLQSAARRIETDLISQPAVAAELSALVGASFNELGDLRAGLDWLPKAVELCTRELGATHRLTLQSRWRWVEAANTVGELTVSERLLPALVRDVRATAPAEPALLVSALQSHAFMHTKRGREAAAMAALHEAVEVATARLGETSDKALLARTSLANTFGHFRRSPEELAAILPAVANARAVHAAQRPHPVLALVERCYADALSSNDRPQDAVAILRQSLIDHRALDSDDTIRVRVTMTMLARALLNCGHFDEALALYIDAQALHQRLTGGANDEGVTMWNSLAIVCALRGDGETALAHVAQGDTVRGIQDEVGVLSLEREAMRALVQVTACRYGEALATSAAALVRQDLLRGGTATLLWRCRAAALRQTGSTTDARAAAASAIAAFAPGLMSLGRGLALAESARCSAAAGDRGTAEAHWREAFAAWDRGQVDGAELLDPMRAEFAAFLARD